MSHLVTCGEYHLVEHSPDCTLHTAITRTVTYSIGTVESHVVYTTGVHVWFFHCNTVIMWVIAVCNLQSELEIRNNSPWTIFLFKPVLKHFSVAQRRATMTFPTIHLCPPLVTFYGCAVELVFLHGRTVKQGVISDKELQWNEVILQWRWTRHCWALLSDAFGRVQSQTHGQPYWSCHGSVHALLWLQIGRPVT